MRQCREPLVMGLAWPTCGIDKNVVSHEYMVGGSLLLAKALALEDSAAYRLHS